MSIRSVVFIFVMAQSIACSQSQTPRARDGSTGTGPYVNFNYVLYGEEHQLAELQGRPLVLVLMRTSDIPSQVYMTEVKTALDRIAGTTGMLVLTIAPSEAPFVELYSESEDLPFAIGVADETVLLGTSPLGKVPVVPTTYFIDGNGRLQSTLPGVVRAEAIVQSALKLAHN